MRNQNVETPQWFIDELRRVVGVEIKYDMAANAENAKAETWFGEDTDSLKIDWPTDGVCWCNPPLKKLKYYYAKYKEQALIGSKILAISPISADRYTEYAWTNNTVCLVVGRNWKLEVRSCMLTFWNIPKPSMLKVVNEKIEWIW